MEEGELYAIEIFGSTGFIHMCVYIYVCVYIYICRKRDMCVNDEGILIP